MDLSINQRSTPQSAGWWAWQIWLDGPDALLDQVDSVAYTFPATYPDPKQRVTDRISRFALQSRGRDEFTISAEVRMHDGTTILLDRRLRPPELTAGGGRALYLTGASEYKTITDDLKDRLEKSGFTIFPVPDPPTLSKATAAVALLSSSQDSLLDNELKAIRATRIPLLIGALQAFEIPPCLAAYRCPQDRNPAETLVTWLLGVLDRPQLTWDGEALPHVASAFWNRRLALAAVDLQRARQCVFSLSASGGFQSTAVAVARNIVIAAAANLPATGLVLRTPSNDCPVEQIVPGAEVAVLRLPIDLPTFLPLAQGNPTSPLVAALTIDTERRVSLSPGWLAGTSEADATHDARTTTPGTAVVALENGVLLGIDLHPGLTVPASRLRTLLPPDSITTPSAGLESVADDFLERAKPEDYANRKGYDRDFLGVSVPLPKANKQFKLLPYTNFTVALSAERRLTLYAVVNINGHRLVEIHRSGDPWQLDPRIPENQQVGGSYYAGTPLDRGHMVRRIDPVWGKDADQAERDTFHYPNSCPQHKNLNRKTWNDLEDYIYINLQREDLKVTVFTGPVLAGDDALFHDVRLPKEFWKVAVVMRDDGKLSATAYLLSQEDMIEGLEFVYGEFRTYQVSIALIERKTGLDFGTLRNCDPVANRTTLEAADAAPTEIREPQDLELDFRVAVAKSPAPPAATENVWQDSSEGERRLNLALNTFDWSAGDALNSDLIAMLGREPGRFDEPFARRILALLQHKRRFSAITGVGDAFLQQGFASPQVRRRYAQALIDQGFFHAAERVLHAIIDEPAAPPFEKQEAQGLLGRIGKQVYVNANAPTNLRNVGRLQNAVDSYWLSYASNPTENYWHGVNVIACLRRAESDAVKLQAPADPEKVAGDILKNLLNRESQSQTGELPPFELAMFVEVHLALGQYSEALARAKIYADNKDADAFEIASTLRQLEEVWRLRDNEAPGDMILPVLRAAVLAREGGSLQLSALSVRSNLEKVFGDDRSLSLDWYRDGLERAKSIARIETNGKGFGTGWLVKASDFFPGRNGFLLITNAHVIGPASPDRYPESLRPEDATIHFQIQEWRIPAGKVEFHSPVNNLDATFLELPDLPSGATALPLDPSVLEVADPPQRLYIIGYPGGRDLEFSLQDNHLLAANERLVHYRTPSEGGSSGSPVFGPNGWKVVALHHAGRKDMPRLDGQPGTYEANEGIALSALRKATASVDPGVR